jgi:prepilin-type N-terminal cleavage/methylation domain-containing protein/prepilin-type processing-associated H-X9-DG protein
MRQRAFTLIELLLVIAIISLLVSILLPALSRSRQLGRATVCLSNLRSMSESVLMYADNNDGRLPTGGLAHGGSVDETAAWINTAARELGSDRISHCPSDQSPHWLTPVPESDQKRRMSYANNYYMQGTIEEREEFTVLTRIKRPATTIFWAELAEQGAFAAADHVHPETWFANPRVLAAQEVQLERHLARANYGFLDGHAEPQSFEDTYKINLQASQFPNIVWHHNKYDPVAAW